MKHTSENMPAVGDIGTEGVCIWTEGSLACWFHKTSAGARWGVVSYGPRGGTYPAPLNSYNFTSEQVMDITLALSRRLRYG